MASPQEQPEVDTRVVHRGSPRWRGRTVWTVWLVATGLFFAGGTWRVVQHARSLSPALSGDRAASDRFLTMPGLAEPTATIDAALDSRPADEAVYLVLPGDHPQKWGTFYAMSPLAWPRPFGLIACSAGGGAEQVVLPLPAQPPNSPVSVVLWSPAFGQPDPPVVLAAPNGPLVKDIGPELQLITGQEGDIWASFCSP